MEQSTVTWEVTPVPGRGNAQSRAGSGRSGRCCCSLRMSCRYFWALLSPEVPLVWALVTRGDDPWAAGSINPGRQSLLLSCAPLPLPGQLSGSVSDPAVFRGNGTGKLQNASGVSRMPLVPRLGESLPAPGIKRGFNFCSQAGSDLAL